jgi:hypothetical protein
MLTINCELTDTFAGEANYSWVRRASVQLPENASRRAIVRAAKSALGITGAPCDTTDFGDMFSLRLRGACIVAFITFND